MKNLEVAPSILAADFLNLKQELERCKKAKIQWIHYDVMDYDFVPNLTFGSKILQDITREYSFKMDLHFMVKVKTKNFADFFVEYLKAKPAMMTMHCEAMNEVETKKFLDLCQENQILASLAIKPNTPISALEKFLPRLDNILVMTVEPGFGGQKFIASAALKIGELQKIAKEKKYHYSVEVDGGIDNQTIKVVKNQGVDLVVAGSYLFGHQDFETRVKGLKNE